MVEARRPGEERSKTSRSGPPVGDPAEVCRRLVGHGLLGGLPLAGLAPGLADGLLVAVTERRTKADVDRLAEAMATVLAELGAEATGRGGRDGEEVAR